MLIPHEHHAAVVYDLIQPQHTAIGDPALRDADREPIPGLSPRENEVAEPVAQGCSNREIADALLISEGSARSIISSVLDKLDLRDRTQLAIFYWRRTR